MMATGAAEFADYLRGKHSVAGGNAESADAASRQGALRKLWELTDLSASDFADEVARFYRLPRVGLPELLAASALVKQFSSRFLREMSAQRGWRFPYRRRRSKRFRLCARSRDCAQRCSRRRRGVV